jgi:molybdopterin-guanine dinucleotide biosynthesis protein B
MRAIAVVGFKKSGKTTLAMELATELKKLGHTVTLVKHSHHGFDEKADTDTARFREHADMVMGFSPGGSFVSWPGERSILDLLPFVTTEYLVLEGGKTLGIMPRIIIAPDEATAKELDPELALAAYGDTAFEGLMATRDVAGLARITVNEGFILPGLDCGSCGRKDCRALAADIVAGEAGLDDCKVRSAGMRVSIGGKALPLNPFVERILASGIRGLLSELKGAGPGPVDIHIDQP